MEHENTCRGTTEQFASHNLVKPQTVRAQYSKTGSYHGIQPTKLASGKLIWPLVLAVAKAASSA